MHYKKQDILAFRKHNHLNKLMVATLRNFKLKKWLQIQKIDLHLEHLEELRTLSVQNRNQSILKSWGLFRFSLVTREKEEEEEEEEEVVRIE